METTYIVSNTAESSETVRDATNTQVYSKVQESFGLVIYSRTTQSKIQAICNTVRIRLGES